MLIIGNMVLLSDMQQEWMFTCQNIGYEKIKLENTQCSNSIMVPVRSSAIFSGKVKLVSAAVRGLYKRLAVTKSIRCPQSYLSSPIIVCDNESKC